MLLWKKVRGFQGWKIEKSEYAIRIRATGDSSITVVFVTYQKHITYKIANFGTDRQNCNKNYWKSLISSLMQYIQKNLSY